MADATSAIKVDGVEPSIPVNLLDVKNNPERIKLFTAEDGTERFLVKGADTPTLVTNADLNVLGGYEIKIGKDNRTSASALGQNATEVVISPVSENTPGQSGQTK
jgi:hypothetical protein